MVEHRRGNNSIPEFVLPQKLVDHICKPFAMIVIVKLLGWSIGLRRWERDYRGCGLKMG